MVERFSPAKINAFLHILGRRGDGYHELETLMIPLDTGDRLWFEAGGTEIRLEIEGRELDAGPENLIVRAAEAVRRKAGIRAGMRIRLLKELPLGGGLAGGSSNAAVTLRTCNELWEAGLGEEDLHGLAAGLGSDINFFLAGGAALCRGRGERVEAVEMRTRVRVLLVHPGFPVPTPWAFQSYARARKELKRGENGALEWAWSGAQGAAAAAFRNDLEPVVMEKYCWLREAKAWLREREEIEDAGMSGSGATVFGILRSGADEKSLKERIRAELGEGAWIAAADTL